MKRAWRRSADGEELVTLEGVLRAWSGYDGRMSQQISCTRIRLKPGSLPLVREWAAELTRRAAEVLATLRDETARIESVFLDSGPDGDYLVYYMRVDDPNANLRAVQTSTHAIDEYHRAFMGAVVDSRQSLELLVDFDRTNE